MKLYNSFTRTLDDFQLQTEPVTIYVCGITPYDTTHVGHAATYCAFDVLVRYLEYGGHSVVYTQNVTDIDDDILVAAKKRGTGWQQLGNKWTAHFIHDMIALNIRPPDFYPRATDVIPEIVAAVRILLGRGLAYQVDGNVYFDVTAAPDLGQLSHISSQEDLLRLANERGNFPDDPRKRHPLDFVLWQMQQPDEPAWESPWGWGRPGWHIECSSMALKYLGPTIDIHGGGADLIFPHHECETAQTIGCTGMDHFARFWVHTAMVYYQGEKMSKSLGNLVMISDLLPIYPPDLIRLYISSHHYRQVWEYTEQELQAATATYQQLRAAANTAPETMNRPVSNTTDLDFFHREFLQALDADLDTPSALNVLSELSAEIIEGAKQGQDVDASRELLCALTSVLGLRLTTREPVARVRQGWSKHLERFPIENE